MMVVMGAALEFLELGKMNDLYYGLLLSSTVDDFGDMVTLMSWASIVARMDFILSEGE